MSPSRDIAAKFVLPSDQVVNMFLRRLKELEENKYIAVEFKRIRRDHNFPWSRESTTMNVSIRFLSPELEAWLPQDNQVDTVGMGWGNSLERAATHAACEALERIFMDGSGLRKYRDPHRYYSLSEKIWRRSEFDFTQQLWSSGKNPWYNCCGEAFHPIKEQSMRAALCESIEREVVSGFVTQKYHECLNVTNLMTREIQFLKDGVSWFQDADYDVALISPVHPFQIHVVIALCRSRKTREFKCAFYGSGSDFSLQHAASQAFVELARNAFFGEVSRCNNAEEAISLRSDETTPECQQRVLTVALPEGEVHINPLMEIASKSKCASQSGLDSFLPEDSVKAIISAGYDIIHCPIFEERKIIPGYCYKFIIPGFNTSSGIIHEKKD